jgi:hypothetical protein
MALKIPKELTKLKDEIAYATGLTAKEIEGIT